MIDVAISHVAAQLNQSLRSRFGVAEDLVAISSLLEQDGSVVPEVANKVVAFLVNVERETLPYRVGGHSGGAGRSVVTNAPVYLNLLVMFAANFGGRNYAEALKFLSGTIGFFQARPAFDPQSSPGLDPRIDKLTLEIENLNTADLSNLWGIFGGKYLPSILYRMRMVTIDEGRVTGQDTPILRPRTAVAP
jgi:hypothetical protein